MFKHNIVLRESRDRKARNEKPKSACNEDYIGKRCSGGHGVMKGIQHSQDKDRTSIGFREIKEISRVKEILNEK